MAGSQPLDKPKHQIWFFRCLYSAVLICLCMLMRSLSARWTKASRWTPAVEDSSRHPTCTKHQRFSSCSRHLKHQITRPIQHFLANHRVFRGAHPNLKLLKFGFRRVVLLHVLEWSHNSHILTLSPSVFRKKKRGYVFFSPFCFRLSSCRYFRVSPFLQLVWNSFELWEGSWDRLY